MSTFKQLVEGYEKEYDRYIEAGLTESEALDLVTKHIRDGKKPVSYKKEELNPEPKKEECKCKKSYKDPFVKEWYDDTFNYLFNYDKYLDNLRETFWKSMSNSEALKELKEAFLKETKKEEKKPEQPEPEQKKVEPKVEPKPESKEVVPSKESNDLKILKEQCAKNGDKINVISDKPNHVEYEINKPNGTYYKYCFKQY